MFQFRICAFFIFDNEDSEYCTCSNHKLHMFRLPNSDFWDSNFALRNKIPKILRPMSDCKFCKSRVSGFRHFTNQKCKCSNKEVRMYRFPIFDISILEVLYFQIKKCQSSYFIIKYILINKVICKYILINIFH